MNKTKFFSSLLVAVLFATTSVFVSCKDYDDDIKNLQSQIDKAALKADLDALSTKLAGVESTANAAKTTAENALAKANANATEIAAVKATAEKAAKDAAAALTAVATAQTTAEAAQAAADGAKTLAENAQKAADAAQATANAAATKKDLEDAVKKVEDAAKALSDAAATKTELAEAKKELKEYTDAAEAAALKTAEAAATAAEKALTDAKGYTDAEVVKINDNIKTLATKEALGTLSKELNDEITGLKKTLEAITDEEKMDELVDIIGNFDTIVETLFSAVTSVSLYMSGYADSWYENIRFYKVVEQENKFPTDAEIAAGQYTADKQYTFTEGKNITGADSIFIRVSPSSAKIDASMISLINSQGDALSSDLVVVDRVEPFEGLITTRGAIDNNGLWKVVFKTKDGYSDEAFDAATKDEKGIRQIAFAVAINNTSDNAADRRIVSEYNVTVATPNAYHANIFNVTVGEETYPINWLHNRYSYTETRTGNYYNYAVPTNEIPELSWIGDCQTKVIISDPAATTDNAVNRNGSDNRQNERILYVDVNEDIEIEYVNNQTPLKGFYVTLDKDFAIESQPSEINAWNSYSYTNVGTKTTKAKMFDGNKGVIQINDADAKGDYIGFRVYAVNLDGTLVDPDGRAFYVHVGKLTEESQASTADVLANQVQPTSELTADVLNFMTWDKDRVGYEWTIVNDASEFPNGRKPYISLGYADKDGNVTNWTGYFNGSLGYFYDDSSYKTVSIVAKFQDIAQLYDGQSITIKGTPYKSVSTDQQGQYQVIENAEITVTITKKMPTFPVELQGRAEQFKNAQSAAQQFFFDGTAKLYLLETANKYELTDWTKDWTNPLAQGEIDLHGLFYNEGLDATATATYDPANLTFTFADAAVDPNDATKTIDVDVTQATTGTAGTSWVLTLPADLIDNGVHDGKATYEYVGVSTYKKNGTLYSGVNYPVEKAFSAYYLDLWAKDIKALDANACMTFTFGAKDLTWDTADKYEIKNVTTKNGYINPVYGSSSATGSINKNLADLIGYYKVLTATDDAKYKPVLISNSTKKVDYFDVTWNAGTKQFDFAPIAGVENPQGDVPSTLKFWMQDPFGNVLEFAIADKFVVKKKATAAPRF